MSAFIPGLVLLGVGLIGEWLLGPKSTTTKPDSMPQLNNAIRGSAVYVTFGSSRVSAQLVWTKNFKATRQKSSGKGGAKGGGSGGFGAAKGGGASGQNYLYYWDMMFNFGIMDQPAMIRQGWVGGDVLDKNSLNSITANGSSLVQGIFPPNTYDTNLQVAKLSFTEAFYAPGYTTGDANLETWSYFQSQEGLACQWPNTAWLGFNQLNLGQTPSVPQLSFEFVPINTTGYVGDPSYSNRVSLADLSATSWSSIATNATFMLADDKSYIYIPNNANTPIFCPDDDTTISMSETRWLTDAAGAGFDTTDYPYGSIIGITPVPGSPYFLVWGEKDDGLSRDVIMLIYKISGGAASVVATVSGTTGTLAYLQADGNALFYDQITGVLYVGGSWSGHSLSYRQYSIATWPVGAWVADITTISFDFGGSFNDLFDDRTLGPNPTWDAIGLISGHKHTFQSLCDNTGIYIYYGKKDVDYMIANSGVNTIWDAVAAFGVGGHFVKITGDGTNATVTKHDAYFDLSDAGLALDGSASTNEYDDYATPNVSMLPSGDIVLALVRGYADAGGEIHAQFYDVTSGKILVDEQQTLFDPDAEGLSGAYPGFVQLGFNPITMAVNYAWQGGSGTNASYVFGGAWLPTGTDVTPAYIVYRILTSPIFGFATQALFGYTVTTDRINTTSYEAANQWCIDQGIYVSVTYTNQDNLLTVLNELVALYGGYLVDQGGIITFGVVKGDGLNADGSTPRVIDNHHLVAPTGTPPVQIGKAALEDGYNDIQFNYLDRAIDYNQNQAEVSDEVDMDINGPRIKTFPANYVMAGSVATNIAARALWANLWGKDTYTFQLGFKDADLMPGDPITLVDSFDPLLSQGVAARITNWKNSARGVYDVTAVREFPEIVTASTFYSAVTSINPGYGSLVQPIVNAVNQTAYELPQEFQGAKAHVYFGYNQGSTIMGAQLYLSTDGANYILSQDTQPFIVSGRLAHELGNRPRGYVEAGVEFYLMPDSSFTVATPTYCQTYDLDDISTAVRAAGGGVLIVGSEALSIENLTLLGQNHYRAKFGYRGWGGSPISAHNSGAYFHQHAAGIFIHEINADDIGTNISYKIAPYNFAGDVADISSIAANSYTILGYYWLPRVLPRMRIFVDSAQAWSPNTPVVGPYVGVISGGTNATFKWSDAAQLEGFGAGGYGAAGYGHFEADVSTPQYRVEVASKDGTTVHSTVVNTGYFQYTLAQNSADFSGFARDLIVKVTPFNVKGDGPVGDVRSLSMNW